jgi:Type II secretory pathway, component ExeA (predicted ATPase)
MYRSFFHLNRDPFEVSPDPYFMFATPGHVEAFASLYYGIRSRKGFMVLTGEVGTGKTLVLRCLIDQLDQLRVQHVYIFNPLLSPDEFLRYTMAELNLRVSISNKDELLLRLYAYLRQRRKADQTAALIVDEAHLLSREVLEEIRLLGNLESQRSKLLQIALIGQPELDSRLDSPDLRQLKQRIALRCELQPLNSEQTGEYIKWRLGRAGANGQAPLFWPEAMAEIYEHSHGYPRLINTICENVLILACGIDKRVITPELVNDVCKDLRIERQRRIPENESQGTPENSSAHVAPVNVVDEASYERSESELKLSTPPYRQSRR